jgi:hypothetical protein
MNPLGHRVFQLGPLEREVHELGIHVGMKSNPNAVGLDDRWFR